ncbi:MAG TPA: hypothetical protein VF337_01905 [Candidatus Limnocylindrales bacterium]
MSAFAKDMRATQLRALVLYVAVIALGLVLFAVALPNDWAVIGFTLAIFGWAVVPIIPWEIWRRQRGTAVNQLLLGWVDVGIQEWRATDDQAPPRTYDEGQQRLEGRSDDLATALRIPLLWMNAQSGAAWAILDAWQPATATFRARRERLLSRRDFESSGTDDLEAATAAAGLIEDPAERETAQTELAIERARRLQARGKDPFPVLVGARRVLGPLDLREVTAMAYGSPLRRQRLGCLLTLAHLVIVLGLVKLILVVSGS